MKKLYALFALLLAASALSAITLPTGQETAVKDVTEVNGKIVSVVVGVPVMFSTSIGNITAKPNTTCEFYESGALRCVYSDEVKDVPMSCGEFKLTSFYSSRPKNCIPFEFYEDGKLKSAQFSRQGKPFIQTPLGTLQAMQATKATFFKDGSIESFAVYPNQKIAISGFSGTYVQGSTLSFYENGRVKSFTSNAEEFHKRLEMRIKKSTEISCGESGKIISFTPADNSAVKIGELMFLLCRGKPFELYETGSIRRCTVECSGQDFAMGNVLFAYKTAKENFGQNLPLVPNAYLTLMLSESGSLISATADRTAPHLDAFPIVGGMGEKLWTAKSIALNDDGSLFCIDYLRALQVGTRRRPNLLIARPQGFADIDANTPIDVKITKKNTTYEVWKIYYAKDGTQYLVGREFFESPQGNFYDEYRFGIFALKGTDIAQTIYLDDISADSELLFADDGSLRAYTVIKDDSVTEKPVKR